MQKDTPLRVPYVIDGHRPCSFNCPDAWRPCGRPLKKHSLEAHVADVKRMCWTTGMEATQPILDLIRHRNTSGITILRVRYGYTPEQLSCIPGIQNQMLLAEEIAKEIGRPYSCDDIMQAQRDR